VSHSLTHSDMLDSDTCKCNWSWPMAFFGDGDGGQGWQRGRAITAWILQSASPTANVSHASCVSPAPAYN